MGFLPVLKKELKTYFTMPSTYVVFFIFLLLAGYFFYTNLVKFNWFNIRGDESIVTGMWQYFFNDIRLLLTLILPLFTMRLLSEEKRLGTMELMTTYPIRDIHIIIGKYLACVGVFCALLCVTLIYPLMLGMIWDFNEIAPVLCGYLGVLLLGSSLIACGLFISSLTENQVVSAMGTMGVFVFLWFITWNEMIGSEELIAVLKRISLFDRVFDFFRGIINIKDIVFFLLGALYFLFLTQMSLGSREWRGMK